MRKTKTQLKQTALKLLPTNKELGIKPTRKQRAVATAIVEASEVAAKCKRAVAVLQDRTLAVAVYDLPMPEHVGALPKRDISAYAPLEDHFDKGGRLYRLVWRNKWACMYAVTVCDNVSYEVFMRVFAEAASGEIKGVKFSTPAREVFPSDRVFGATAWCTLTQASAAVKFRHAVETAVQRHLEKVGA